MTVSLEQLSAYQDDELAHEQRVTVGMHIAGCPDCQGALRRWDAASRRLATGAPITSRGRRPTLVLTGILALLLLSSGAAVATGLFSEVFRIGNVSAVASRPVSLGEARITGLPLPSSDRLPGGWQIRDHGVHLTMPPDWSIVGLQYDRDGKRGLNVTVFSEGIRAFSPDRLDGYEVLTVRDVPVYVKSEVYPSGREIQAFFAHRGSTLEIHVFGPALDGRDFGSADMAALVEAWMQEAR